MVAPQKGADQANAGADQGQNQNRKGRQRNQDQANGGQAQGGAQGQGFQGGRGQGGQGQGGGGQFASRGQNAQGGDQATGGRGGFGRGMRNNLTPEQLAQFREQFGGRGGRNGGGNGANGNGGGRNRQQDQANAVVKPDVTKISGGPATKIDDLFEAVPKRIQPGQVWLYDEKSADPNKKLRQISVRLGLSDGQFSELVSSGEPIAPGTMVVTGVIPPPSALPKPGQNNPFQQQRGGPGFGPGGPGGPGGGAPRGGGRGGD
jgi:hypothetical protein